MKINVIDFNVYAYIVESESQSLLDILYSEYQDPKLLENFAQGKTKDQITELIVNCLWSLYINYGSIHYQPSLEGCYVVSLNDFKPYWRSIYFPDYKAGRQPKTDYHNLVVKLGIDYHRSRGIPLLSKIGYEADDFMGLMVALKTRSYDDSEFYNSAIHMFTVDSDWLQLVSDRHNIIWINSRHWEPRIRDEEQFLEWFEKRHSKTAKKLNIVVEHPQDLVVLKCLDGDSSDNLPKNLNPFYYDLVNTHPDHNLLYDQASVESVIKSLRVYRQDTIKAKNAYKVLNSLSFNELP